MSFHLESPDALPSGFRYHADVLGVAEERELVAFLEGLVYEPYVMRGVPSRRGVCFFGATYGRTSLGAAPPIPDALKPLRARVCSLAGQPDTPFIQALVNRYPPGAGIGWHSDIAAYGPIVLGVSIGARCRMRFRHPSRPRAVVEQVLEPRSVYELGGAARREWQHQIPPEQAGIRWSVTFRTVR